MFALSTWNILEDKWWQGFAEAVFNLGFDNRDSSVSCVKTNEGVSFWQAKTPKVYHSQLFRK